MRPGTAPAQPHRRPIGQGRRHRRLEPQRAASRQPPGPPPQPAQHGSTPSPIRANAAGARRFRSRRPDRRLDAALPKGRSGAGRPVARQPPPDRAPRRSGGGLRPSPMARPPLHRTGDPRAGHAPSRDAAPAVNRPLTRPFVGPRKPLTIFCESAPVPLTEAPMPTLARQAHLDALRAHIRRLGAACRARLPRPPRRRGLADTVASPAATRPWRRI
jgi:hypothetical protein